MILQGKTQLRLAYQLSNPLIIYRIFHLNIKENVVGMKQMSDFPSSMGKVAPRELAVNGIHSLEQTTEYTEKELLAIHGVGPRAVRIIKEVLAKKNLSLKTTS